MHAQRDPAEPDRGHHDGDRHGDRCAGPLRQRGREDQQQGAVSDDRTERVPAGKAVAAAGGHRVRHDRAQPADRDLQRRVQDQRTDPGDEQVQRQPVPVAHGQHDYPDRDQPAEEAETAQAAQEAEGEDDRAVPGDGPVQGGREPLVDPLQRYPL